MRCAYAQSYNIFANQLKGECQNMKFQHRLISFALILSLLFSSLVFTSSAADQTDSTGSNDNPTQTEFFTPTASFTPATSATKDSIIKNAFANFSYFYASDVIGDGCLQTYLVEGAEDDNTNSYVMITPTDEADANGTIPAGRHSQINAGMLMSFVRNNQSNYYVFETDISTDAILLPMKYQVVVRVGGTAYWSSKYNPSANFINLITPGVFHHVTFVGEMDTNILYIFVDNHLVDVLNNGITSADYHKKYMESGATMSVEAMRIQMSPGEKIPSGSSICFDNAKERVLLGSSAGNIADCIEAGDLTSWSENINYSAVPVYLPSIVEINGVKYNDTQSATAALQTYKLGTKVKALRPCYGGVITVNCDAEITIPVGADIDFEAGEDVDIIKGDGSLWHAVLKNFKHSAEVISKNEYYITQYVRHPALDNLIDKITQNNAINERTFSEAEFENLATLLDLTEAEKALFEKNTDNGNTTYKISNATISSASSATLVNKFKSHSIDGSIISTESGNDYLIVQDNSGKANDFPINVHYQVNANTNIPADGNDSYIDPSEYQIGNHKFVVFEQDIHSESEFINVYTAFNLRTPNNIALSNIAIFAENINITPEKWYHLTYIGEVASGDTYLFLDGKCVSRIVSGLYDEAAIGKMAATLGMIDGVDKNDKESIKNTDHAIFTTYASQLTEAQRQECIDSMVLASFRTMQIAGENKSGKNLTPDMSAASDNYYLRWADDDSMTDLIAQIDADYDNIPEGSDTPDKTIDGEYYINSWGDNIYDASYIENILPEKALIATINGVEYFDTTSINDMLDDIDNANNENDYAEYTTPIQEIIIYREYIGTINVNCRATVTINGVKSNVAYGDGVDVDSSGAYVKVYKQTSSDTGNEIYPVACVDGILYYANGSGEANDETALKNLLESRNASQLTVTFLRTPSVSININSNAVVDRNGLTMSNVTIDTTECVTASGSETDTVINLITTKFIANVNGVNYSVLSELQSAIIAADEVTVEFYQVPDTPLTIACPASIDTNGLIKDGVLAEDLFVTDITIYVITAASDVNAKYDYTIIKDIKTATVEIRVVDGSTLIRTERVTGKLGTDIENLLTEHGFMNGIFVTNGNQLNITSWSEEPSGTITEEDFENGDSRYVFTANVDTNKSKTISQKYACVINGEINETDSESTAIGWLSSGTNLSIILNADLTVPNSSSISGGAKSVYLNGHTIHNNSTNQGFSVATTVNFFGNGTINYLTNASTHALFFIAYNPAAKIALNGVNVNSSAFVGIIREGSLEFNNCTISSYAPAATAMFSLGEQYNGYSNDPISLTLRNCDVTYRYANVVDFYKDFTVDNPLIYNKIVTHKQAGAALTDADEETTDAPRTIIIDGCTIKTQGSLVSACNSVKNLPTDYLKSNMQLYVNDTDIIAKSIVKGSIKPNSIFFCDDVRTNVTKTHGIAFMVDLVKAQTSDGIYKILYTSHDYATITWSNGAVEIWASGSTPVNRNCLFDTVTTAGSVKDGDYSYTSTGESFPFGLYMNLTLTSRIGFNIYVPTDAAADVSKVKVYMDGKLIEPNTYADSDTVRTSLVAAAGKQCYDYTLDLAPQDAAKSFTLVIICNGQYVSRKVSVADYAEKLVERGLTERTKALLQVTLAYIEQATMFAGNTVDMERISALRTTLGTTSAAPIAPKTPAGAEAGASNFGTGEGGLGYFSGAQINVMGTCAFRFNLTGAADADSFTFYVANDAGTEYELREHTVAKDGSYIELSLNAYELARSIKIVYNGGAYDLYSLYDYYGGVYAKANPASVIGQTYEYKATQKLIETLYSYASICDKYYDKNAAEYDPSSENGN